MKKLRRIFALLKKEFVYGSKSFFFIIAIVIPISISLINSLVLGDLLSGKPKMGIFDQGNSQLVEKAGQKDFLTMRLYDSSENLKNAVRTGKVDIGYIFPEDIDNALKQSEAADIEVYQWGEAQLNKQLIIFSTFLDLVMEISGKQVPVEFNTISIGSEETIVLHKAILPFIVLIAIMFGGLYIPATSLVQEKTEDSLQALTTTPMTYGEILISKAIMGILVSLVMGIIILILNDAFGSAPLLLIGLLSLCAIFTSSLGLIFGILAKDIVTLTIYIKSIVLIVYTPAVLSMFPKVPDWIAKVFPTYYLFTPIVEISLNGKGLGDVLFEVGILIGITALMILLLSIVSKRQQAG